MGQHHAPTANYPRERPGTHCKGGWVGLRAGLDRYGKSHLHRNSIPGPSSPQAVAIPTELPGLQFRPVEQIFNRGGGGKKFCPRWTHQHIYIYIYISPKKSHLFLFLCHCLFAIFFMSSAPFYVLINSFVFFNF